MAEKEERISVLVYEKDPCENCPGNPMADCQVCEKDLRYDGGMTRQEAIERMAKALVEYEKTNNPNACEWNDLKEMAKDIYRERAEAALNALLEE